MLQLKVEGDGYLRFFRNGSVFYAKEATVHIRDGKLMSQEGHCLLPTIWVPQGVQCLDVNAKGYVWGYIETHKYPLGRLALAVFPQTAPLVQEGTFWTSKARPQLYHPGEQQTGFLCATTKGVVSQEPAYEQGRPQEQLLSSAFKKPSGHTVAKPPLSSTVPQNSPQRAHIVIHPYSEVGGNTFKLGEIATIHAEPSLNDRLSRVEIGETPIHGAQRGLNLSQIQSRLKMAGFRPSELDISLPENAKVARKGQRIPHEEFVHRALESARSVQGDTFPLLCVSPKQDIVVPLGQVELVVEQVVPNGSTISCTLAIYIDGRRYNARTMVLKKQEPVMVLRPGALVRLVVRANRVRVETTGRIRSPGYLGTPVEVQTSQGALLAGILLEGGIVEVRL
jgi:hypothetical protein